MPSSSRSKRARNRIEPITLEELADTPGMSGICSFLQTVPATLPPLPQYAERLENEGKVKLVGSILDESGEHNKTEASKLEASTVEASEGHASARESSSKGKVEAGKIDAYTLAATTVEASDVDASTFEASIFQPSPSVPSAAQLARNPAPVVVLPVPAHPQASTVQASTVAASTSEASLFDASIFESDDFQRLRSFTPRPPKPIPIATVQESHTTAEQRVFDWIWKNGTEIRPGIHGICIGDRRFARESGLPYTTIRRVLPILAAKLSIDVLPSPKASVGPNSADTILAYSFGMIARRRREAGLTHMIRHTSSIVLTDSQGRTQRDASTLDASICSSEASQPDATVFNPEASNLHASSQGAISLYKQTTESKAVSSTIVAALRETFGRADDDAATRIATDCRRATPDVTDQEIAFFIRQEGTRFLRMSGVGNPIGLLIRHLPKVTAGESLRQHRDEVRRAATAQLERDLQTARECLADPETPPDLRAWAEQIIASAEQGGEGKGTA
jgi:hypothetical protein